MAILSPAVGVTHLFMCAVVTLCAPKFDKRKYINDIAKKYRITIKIWEI